MPALLHAQELADRKAEPEGSAPQSQQQQQQQQLVQQETRSVDELLNFIEADESSKISAARGAPAKAKKRRNKKRAGSSEPRAEPSTGAASLARMCVSACHACDMHHPANTGTAAPSSGNV